MRSTGYTYQLLVGQEYELEHKLEGRPVQESASEKLDNNCQVKGSTREKLAKEHGVSQGTVQRSADLYNSVKTISEVAPGCNNRSMAKGRTAAKQAEKEGSGERVIYENQRFAQGVDLIREKNPAVADAILKPKDGRPPLTKKEVGTLLLFRQA